MFFFFAFQFAVQTILTCTNNIVVALRYLFFSCKINICALLIVFLFLCCVLDIGELTHDHLSGLNKDQRQKTKEKMKMQFKSIKFILRLNLTNLNINKENQCCLSLLNNVCKCFVSLEIFFVLSDTTVLQLEKNKSLRFSKKKT